MTVVVTVSEYDGPAGEALIEMMKVQERYEGFNHVYVADTLADLPHPMQITAIRNHFEGDVDDNRSQWFTVQIPGYGSYTLRNDMPPVQQIEMAREILEDSDGPLSPEDVELGVQIVTHTLRHMAKDNTLR